MVKVRGAVPVIHLQPPRIGHFQIPHSEQLARSRTDFNHTKLLLFNGHRGILDKELDVNDDPFLEVDDYMELGRLIEKTLLWWVYVGRIFDR